MQLRRLFVIACAPWLVAGSVALVSGSAAGSTAVASGSAADWPAADETERFQRTVPLAPGGTVRIHNFSGRITITGTDRGEVAISATRTATRERLDHIKLDVQVSGTTVEIEANKRDLGWKDRRGNNVVDTEMEIQVPRHTDLRIDVFSSPIAVTGIEGSHHVKTFSGDLRLVGATGPVDSETFSGRIEVELTPAAVAPRLTLRTFSGDIDVRVADSARAGVAFETFSGDLSSDHPLTFRSQSRGSLRADLGGGGGDASISMKTFSGDARLLKLR